MILSPVKLRTGFVNDIIKYWEKIYNDNKS